MRLKFALIAGILLLLAGLGLLMFFMAASPRRAEARPVSGNAGPDALIRNGGIAPEDLADFELKLMTRATKPPAVIAAGDTVWYGGTAWNPDSLRWEAIRDSVWTFDTGVGSSINTGADPNKPAGYHETMEGWRGLDLTVPNDPFFRRSSTCAISGSWSLWAGVTQHEADSLCYAGGQGYGNSWRLTAAKTFAYPGSGSVTLSYDYAVEAETDFDYAFVVVDTAGAANPDYFGDPGDVMVRSYTGFVSGTDAVVLTPGTTLRSTPGPVTVKFVAVSDGLYSDEDGLFPTTCGLAVFDDVGLSGSITDFSDFESGDDGWTQLATSTGLGDFSNLAFVDSLGVPSVPGPCSLEDSVLVFFDPSYGQSAKQNIAVSPWIDLVRGGDTGRPGRIISFDVYAASSPIHCPNNFTLLYARWYPSTCAVTGLARTTDFRYLGFQYFGSDPFCTAPGAPWTVDVTGLIDAGATRVQIAVGVSTSENCLGPVSTPGDPSTPWFDNVRFGVYGGQSGVTEPVKPAVLELGPAFPNPFRASTSIAFTLAEPGRAVIRITDVTGRLVRTLVDRHFPEGAQTVAWDGADDGGRRVAAGLYIYRLSAGLQAATGKVIVIG